jgi:hypothetical protein
MRGENETDKKEMMMIMTTKRCRNNHLGKGFYWKHPSRFFRPVVALEHAEGIPVESERRNKIGRTKEATRKKGMREGERDVYSVKEARGGGGGGRY